MGYLKQIYILIIPLILFLIAASYFTGVMHTKHKYELENLKTQQVQNVENQKIDKQNVAQQAKVITQYKYITKEVIKYVPTPNAHLWLNGTWVCLHDNSISDSGTPCQSNGTTAGTAIATVTQNYSTCEEWRNELLLWQEWARQSKIIRKEYKFLGII